MAQTVQEIAKDIVIAWLSQAQVSLNVNEPASTGQKIGEVYKAIVKAIEETLPGRR